MNPLDRKSFIRTLGMMGAGTILTGNTAKGMASTNEQIRPTAKTDPPGNSSSKRVLRVAHLTDIHVKADKISEYGMAAALHTVNNMEDKPDLIINGGDAVMDAGLLNKSVMKEQWSAFHRILKNENSLPVYHCIGNHDVFGWMLPSPNHTESKQWAKDEYLLTSSYYSFTVNGWKMIVLDSIHGRKSVPGYFGKLDDEQMVSLKNELKNTAPDTHICIVSHIPVLAICCLFDNDITSTGRLKISENNMHYDSNELVQMFYANQNVKACLSGHIHLIDYVNYLGTEYFCNGAVAGDWWKGRHQQFDPALCMMNFFEDGTVTREVNYYKWQG